MSLPYLFYPFAAFISSQSVECYNEYSRQWQFSKPMLFSRSCFAAVALDGYIYALGGYGNVHLSSVEKYNPRRNEWSLVPAMSTARNNFGACALHGFIYAVGELLKFSIELIYKSLVDNSNLLTEQINLYKYERLLL